MPPQAKAVVDGVTHDVGVTPDEVLVALPQADEAIFRIQFIHVDAVVQFHRNPVQRAVQHSAVRDQEGGRHGSPRGHL
ncbi:hypothetical protein D9M68_920400 [compost metagenome]